MQQIEVVEQLKKQYAQKQESSEKPVIFSDMWSEVYEALVEKNLDKPAYERAWDQATNTLLWSALLAALIHSLSGTDFLGQWRLPQVCVSTILRRRL